MGQSKQNKLRLGKWYGQPIGPGHPDFLPPKKPEPIPPLVRFARIDCDEPPIDIGAENVHFSVEARQIVVDRLFSLYTEEPIGAWFSGNEGKGILWTGSVARLVELGSVDDRTAVFVWPESTKEEPTRPEVARTLTDIDGTREGPTPTEQRPSERLSPMRQKGAKLSMFQTMAMLGVVMLAGIDLGPEPVHRPKK